MAAVLSNDGSSHKSRHHSKIPIHSTRRKTRSTAVGRSPKNIPSIIISSTVPITPVSSTITISSSSPDYNESWPSSEQATPPSTGRSLFHDEKQSCLKEDIDTTLSLSTSSLQSSPPTQTLSHMEQKYDQTLTERTQQLIDNSTALIQCPGPNISLHHKEPSASPLPPCVEEGDILQQWRLRRRLEEARRQATASSVSHLDTRVRVVPHCSVPEKDIATLYESRPSCIVQQETCISRAHNSHPSQNYHHESSHDHHHKSHNPHDHHHKSHQPHDHHHKSHHPHDHHHKSHHPRDHHHKYRDYHHKSHNSHNSHAVQNHNASSPCNVDLCRHISEQRNKKRRSTNKKERLRESSELQKQPIEQKEMPVKEKRRQFKGSSWKEECVRYPLSLSFSDDDTSWDTDTLITDNTSPPPHSSSPPEDVSLTQLLAETVQHHLYGTPPPAESLGVPSHIYPTATPCPQVDNHLKDDLLADLFKRTLSLTKKISEVDQLLAVMDTA